MTDKCNIMKQANELSALLVGLLGGGAFYDSEFGEYVVLSKAGIAEREVHLESATFLDWMGEQLDVEIYYKRTAKADAYALAGVDILMTMGGPTIRLRVFEGYSPVLFHSWGVNAEGRTMTECRLRSDLTVWILDELAGVYCG